MVMQIDRDELRAGFLKLGEKLSEEDIDAIMELADDDGDDTIDITVLAVLHQGLLCLFVYTASTTQFHAALRED
jgi:hypothetical protein